MTPGAAAPVGTTPGIRGGSEEGPGRFASAAFVAFLCLLVAAIYWRTVHFSYVNFDDNIYVYENPHVVGGLSRENIAWAFTAFHNGYWHPLTMLSHMLDAELFGSGAPGMHHLTNIIIHLANSILLFLFLRRATGRLWPSAVAAALFSAHPLRVESVAWVSERKDLLSAFFWMLSLHAYDAFVARRGTGRYLLVFLSMLAGLMCKPMLVTLPFVLVLLDWWPYGRMRQDVFGDAAGASRGSGLPALLREKIPLIVLCVLFAVVTIAGQARYGSVRIDDPMPFLSRLSNAIVSCGTYIEKTFWPSRLAILYPHPWTYGGSIPPWKVLAALLFVTMTTWGAWRVRDSHPYLLAGWLWYLVSLIPVLGLVQAGNQAMADRFTYLPLIGVYVGVVWWLFGVAESRRRERTALFVSGIVVAVFAWTSHVQAGYWRDSLTLFSRAVTVTDKNWLAWNNMGTAYAEKGDHAAARTCYRRCLEIRPDFVHAWYNLGASELAVGSPDRAIPFFREAVRLRPDNPQTWNSLGVAISRTGDPAAAAECYREAIRQKPDLSSAWYNLGIAFLKMDLFPDAARCFREVLRIRPDFPGAREQFEVAQRSGGAGGPPPDTGRADRRPQ